MQPQQEAEFHQQEPGEGRLTPRGGQKLKSERVQWHLQLPEREMRRFQQGSGGRMALGEVITVSFDVTTLDPVLPALSKGEPFAADAVKGSMGGSGAIEASVEAGRATGTPDHNVQPSTQRKEEDHARI